MWRRTSRRSRGGFDRLRKVSLGPLDWDIVRPGQRPARMGKGLRPGLQMPKAAARTITHILQNAEFRSTENIRHLRGKGAPCAPPTAENEILARNLELQAGASRRTSRAQ